MTPPRTDLPETVTSDVQMPCELFIRIPDPAGGEDDGYAKVREGNFRVTVDGWVLADELRYGTTRIVGKVPDDAVGELAERDT